MHSVEALRHAIGRVPHFPKEGILFYDISPLLVRADLGRSVVAHMERLVTPYAPTIIAGVESRGFIMASALALHMGVGFLMVRKKGKLPGRVRSLSYSLEYGHDCVEAQEGLVDKGASVVLVDDLMATGGTLSACVRLLESMALDVKAAVTLVELTSLKGRESITVPFSSVIEIEKAGV
ncbi:MAG: adenine phosphoribosyltransferase [Alphaproteobacteria bacterium GM7ARS4]|nr:adenine phosphoribosyltransferase [Alphaproteobacteria bacterium GM7ARS4]